MGTNPFIRISAYPKLVVIITLCLTFFLSWQAFRGLFDQNGKLVLDNSLEPFFNRSSGAYAFYKSTNLEFGSNELMVIAFQPISGRGFDLQLMLMLKRLHRQIVDEIPGVDRVVSIINTPQTTGPCIGKSFFHREKLGSTCENILDRFVQELDCIINPTRSQNLPFPEEERDLMSSLEADPDDSFDEGVSAVSQTENLSIARFVCNPQLQKKSEKQLNTEFEEAVSEVLGKLKKHSLIIGDLLSADFDTTALAIRFLPNANPGNEETQHALAELLERVKAENLSVTYAGQPREEYASSVILHDDLLKILPLGSFLILFVLLTLFQSVRGVLIPFLVVVMGLCWTAGFLVICNVTLNLVTMVLPPLLIAVGSAYLIHFMAQYDRVSRYGYQSKEEITCQTLAGITLPLTVTAFTTLIGFLALTTSPIPAVRELGLFAGIGITSITLLALTFAPCCLNLFPFPKAKNQALRLGLTDHLLNLINRMISRYASKIIAVWILVGFVAVIGLFQITIDSNTRNMSEETAVIKDKKFIESKLVGTAYLRLVFSGKNSPKTLLSAATMNGILELKNWLLDRNNGIDRLENMRFDKIYTPLEYISIERQGLDNLTDAEVVNFFRRSRGRNLHFFNKEQTLLNITIRLRFVSTASFLKFKQLIDVKIREKLPELDVRYTGSAILLSESADNIVKSQILSLSIALILIFIILSLLFFSWKMGLMALYPNIISILIFFGALGWLSIPIGVTISVIAAIALGIGVDDTIHFITNYNSSLKDLNNEKAASEKTLMHIGRPMFYTTVALTLGFSVFMISEMNSQVLFGILTAFTLCICLTADIILLPSILVQSKLITAWDYLQINYTKDFLSSINLFRGMSVRESKLATLVTNTKDFTKGDIIYEENDPVQDFFVILEGSVEIYIEGKYHGKQKVLTCLKQGSSFGALALFPYTKRMASARAVASTRLLVLTPLNLLNLKTRYPGIAAKLYFNLAKSLAEDIREDFYRIMGAAKSNADTGSDQSDKTGLIGLLNQVMTGVARSSKVKKIASVFQQFKLNWVATEKITYPVVEEMGDEDSDLDKLIDSIISNGKVTYGQKMQLKKLIFSNKVLSPAEQNRLKKLKWLIRTGKVVELKPEFASIFHAMTIKDFTWLRKNFEFKQVPAGARLFSEGDYGDFMMIVFSGRFSTFIAMDKKLIPISTIIPGDSIGEMSLLIDDHTRPVTAKALENSEVLFISLQGFKKMMKANKKLAALFSYNLVGLLSHRLRRSTSLLHG